MNSIQEIIKEKEVNNLIFKPDKSFYEKVQINQKRWGEIYRGKTEPKLSELKNIATFFGVDISKLIY